MLEKVKYFKKKYMTFRQMLTPYESYLRGINSPIIIMGEASKNKACFPPKNKYLSWIIDIARA